MNGIVEANSKVHRKLTLTNTSKLILMVPIINTITLAVLKKKQDDPAQINPISNQACVSNRQGILVLAITSLALIMFHEFSSNELCFLGLFAVAAAANTFYIEFISSKDFIDDILRF